MADRGMRHSGVRGIIHSGVCCVVALSAGLRVACCTSQRCNRACATLGRGSAAHRLPASWRFALQQHVVL